MVIHSVQLNNKSLNRSICNSEHKVSLSITSIFRVVFKCFHSRYLQMEPFPSQRLFPASYQSDSGQIFICSVRKIRFASKPEYVTNKSEGAEFLNMASGHLWISKQQGQSSGHSWNMRQWLASLEPHSLQQLLSRLQCLSCTEALK